MYFIIASIAQYKREYNYYKKNFMAIIYNHNTLFIYIKYINIKYEDTHEFQHWTIRQKFT